MSMTNTLRPIVGALAAASILSGCALGMIEETQKNVRAARDEASARNQSVGEPLLKRRGNVVQSNDAYIPVQRMQKSVPPKAVDPALKRQFNINRTFVGVNDVAERVTLLTGIPVTVAPDALGDPGQLAVGAGQNRAGGAPAAGGAGGMIAPAPGATGAIGAVANQLGVQVPPAPGAAAQMQQYNPGSYNATSTNVVAISYNGTLAGFLDTAAARFNVSWAFNNGKIDFYRFETKTFTLAAVPGDVSNRQSVSSQGGSASTGGGAGGAAGGASGGGAAGGAGGSSGSTGSSAGSSTMTTESASDLSVWRSVEAAVRAMLSSSGQVVVTPSIGTVTVKDFPRNMELVERFIEQQNANLSRQVVINVKVMAVRVNDTNDYGINWNAVYNQLSTGAQWKFLSAAPVVAGASTLSSTILTPAEGNNTRTGQKYGGSDALFQALSTQGDVSVVTSSTNVTLNNQPVPVRVGKQTAYLASSALSTVASVGQTATLTPGVINTGFSMNVLPHIQPDGKLLMQYTVDLSNLVALVTVSSGGSSIQTPEIDTRNFMQRVAMRSGDTIVMSGFEGDDNQVSSQGPFDARNVLMGGAINSKRAKTLIVITLTANVVDKF